MLIACSTNMTKCICLNLLKVLQLKTVERMIPFMIISSIGFLFFPCAIFSLQVFPCRLLHMFLLFHIYVMLKIFSLQICIKSLPYTTWFEGYLDTKLTIEWLFRMIVSTHSIGWFSFRLTILLKKFDISCRGGSPTWPEHKAQVLFAPVIL